MLAWLLVAGAGALALAGLLRTTSEHLLQREAEHVALDWASMVAESVQDLEPLLAGAPLTELTRHDLRRHPPGPEVFQYKLFGRDGHVVLVSDALDSPTPAAAGGPRNQIGHGNATVLAMVMHGRPVVELRRAGDATLPPIYSEAYVPILRGGRLIGVVEVYVDQTERARRVQSAFGIVAVAAFTLLGTLGGGGAYLWMRRLAAQRLAEERVRYLAQHDELSGLLNRASFNAALHEAAWRHRDSGRGFAVLCIDLDHLKEVNDARGHDAGDEVLRQIGERLRALVRQGDRVARLASDEFAILLDGDSLPEAVSALAQRVAAAIGVRYLLGQASVELSCSIGAAIYGVDASTPEELLHRADLALTRAKASGRRGFSFYDETLDRALDERRELAQALRQAIGTAQLTLHYQPLFESDGRTVAGYEALARWSHPQRGAVSPGEFIPLAESIGLIDELGRWVLRTACQAAAGWPGEIGVAVNLSPAQFRQDGLVDDVRAALQASGLAPERLELEITESLLMGHVPAVTSALETLTSMGVRIAMDDFGTGYSSLAYLWRFPFHKVKIDRAFTMHLDSDPKVQLIVRSIISLAHSLGIRVNAEGVETAAQLELLQAEGCDELQGFLLGRPAPAERADGQRRSETLEPPLQSQPS